MDSLRREPSTAVETPMTAPVQAMMAAGLLMASPMLAPKTFLEANKQAAQLLIR
jgi:hypothetical protein